jgi:hypothetical protein
MRTLFLTSIMTMSVACKTTGNQYESQVASDRLGGGDICQVVQWQISKKYSGPFSIGIAADIAGNCTVALTYESSKDLLRLIDRMVFIGDNPLQVLQSGRPVALTHQVIGETKPFRGPGAASPSEYRAVPTSEIEICAMAQSVFEKKLGERNLALFQTNGVGIGAGVDQTCTLSVGFMTSAGYRSFVKHMIEQGMDPTHFRADVNGGDKVQFHIEAQYVPMSEPLGTSSVAVATQSDRECGRVHVLPSTFGNFYQLHNEAGVFGITDNEAPFSTSPLSIEMLGKDFCFLVSKRENFPDIDAKAIEISGVEQMPTRPLPTANQKCGDFQTYQSIDGHSYMLKISETEIYGVVDDESPKVIGGIESFINHRGRVCVTYTKIESVFLEASAIDKRQ